jgi:uncharacterized membrane protein
MVLTGLAGLVVLLGLYQLAQAKKPAPPPEPRYHLILIGAHVEQITNSDVVLTEDGLLIEPDRDDDGNPVWDSDGDGMADGYTTTSLTLGGYPDVKAYSVNEESGLAVGEAFDGVDWHPVLWKNIWSVNGDGTAGTLVYLGRTQGATDGIAMDLNSGGQVVVREILRKPLPLGLGLVLVNPRDTDGDGEPDVWLEDADNDGNNDLMIDLEGTSTGGAPIDGSLRINELGQIAGVSNFGADGFVIIPEDTDGDGLPDTWFKDDDDDGSNDLQIYLGSNSRAHDISDGGLIVGYLKEGRKYYLTQWQIDLQGQVNLIVKESVSNWPGTLKINDNSQVVGGVNNRTGYGILWENGEVLKLIELLDNPENADILWPGSINDSGTIAGASCWYDRSEKMTRCYEGFIAVPLAQ